MEITLIEAIGKARQILNRNLGEKRLLILMGAKQEFWDDAFEIIFSPYKKEKEKWYNLRTKTRVIRLDLYGDLIEIKTLND